MTSTLNRIVFILGGKGGTGKTLHCRQLYYALVQAGVKCLAYDADVENPEFEDYHTECQHKVKRLNFLKSAEAKTLFSDIDQQKPSVVLIDMPGASGKATREQLQKFGAFDLAKDLGYRITFDTVLNNCYNTINSLRIMIDFCGTQADYVAVKSLMWTQEGLNFSRWEKSEERKRFLELNGVEIEMPLLDLSTFDVMHEEALSFFEKDQLPFGDRILINSFLNLSLPELQKAAQYLGLPASTTEATAAKATKSTSKKKFTDPKVEEPAPEVATSGTK
jgi:hypothetical protein